MDSDGQGWTSVGAYGCVWVHWCRRAQKTDTQGHTYVKCECFPGHYGREISQNACSGKVRQGGNGRSCVVAGWFVAMQCGIADDAMHRKGHWGGLWVLFRHACRGGRRHKKQKQNNCVHGHQGTFMCMYVYGRGFGDALGYFIQVKQRK